MLLFGHTVGADAVEIEPVGPDMSTHGRLNSDIEVLLRRNIEILDCTTLFADKMIMLCDHGVVSPKTFTEVELPDFPLLLQNMEVPIHGTKGDPWDMFPHPLIHPFRGGMGRGSSQNLKNFFPLFATFCSGYFHGFQLSLAL